MIHAVPAKLVTDIWPAIERFVESAVNRHPFMTADDVLAVILYGNAQLFIDTAAGRIRGFACMEVIQYPRRKVANVFCSGGERGFLSVAVHDLLPVLMAWGREHNADAFAILGGRPGWVRALRNAGFQSAPYVTMWADLDEGRRKQRNTAADDNLRALEGSSAVSH